MTPEELPVLELAFPGPLRDSGVAAILAGEKTALTGLLEIHEHAGDPVPQPGQRFSVVDSAGQPAAVIELTEVAVVPISRVDDEYARAEGRGYTDAAGWRRAHEEFFCSEGVARFLGATPVISDDTLVVTERFRLIWPSGSGGGYLLLWQHRIMELHVPVDGGHLWADDSGGDGPVVVLLHPSWGDSSIWVSATTARPVRRLSAPSRPAAHRADRPCLYGEDAPGGGARRCAADTVWLTCQ